MPVSTQSRAARSDTTPHRRPPSRNIDLGTIKTLKNVIRLWYGSRRDVAAASLGTDERTLHQWLTGRRPVPDWVQVKVLELTDKAKADRGAQLQARRNVIDDKMAELDEIDPAEPWRAARAAREANRTFVYTRLGYRSVRPPQTAVEGRAIGQAGKDKTSD